LSQNVFFVDLHHTGGDHAEINQLFTEIPSDTHRIFLLGDIFHYWINDPSFIQETYSSFLKKLRGLAEQGIELYFMEGNRDFLAVNYFTHEPWIDVLANPTLLDLNGRAIYMGHGDELCWNDWQYQLYKSVIRSLPVRILADRLPSRWKRKTVERMEKTSKTFVASKSKSSLQIPEKAYRAVFSTGADVIVHGHLHESYQKELKLDKKNGQIFCFGWKNGKRNMIYFEG